MHGSKDLAIGTLANIQKKIRRNVETLVSDKTEFEYTFVIERSEDGGWSAACPDLPGLVLAGDTQVEMLKDAREIVADYVMEMTKRGFEIPQPGEHFVKIAVPAA